MVKHTYTEDQMMMKLRREAKGRPHRGQFVSDEAITKVRRRVTNKSNWNTAKFDAWLVRQWEEGAIKMREGDPRISSPTAREATTAKSMVGPQMAASRMMTSVREWVRKRGKHERVTASMVKTMGMNLKRKCTAEVDAALVILAAKGEIIVENRKQGQGGAGRQWAKESLEWAVQQKWITRTLAKEYEAKSKGRIEEHERKETVCIELGSGWGGATEGLNQVFDRVIEVDKEQQKLKGGSKTKPDILTTFQQGTNKKGGLARWIAINSRVKQGELVAGWASPSCTEHSVSAGMNKGTKHAAGHYAGKTMTKESRAGLQAVIEGFKKERASNPTFQFAIENVGTGALAKEDTSAGKMMRTSLGKPIMVTGCAYGRKSMKKYAIWMSPEARARFAKERILPKDRRSKCKACKEGRVHEQVGILPIGNPHNQARVSEQGFTPEGAANRVPPALAQHIGQCMIDAWKELNKD